MRSCGAGRCSMAKTRETSRRSSMRAAAIPEEAHRSNASLGCNLRCGAGTSCNPESPCGKNREAGGGKHASGSGRPAKHLDHTADGNRTGNLT